MTPTTEEYWGHTLTLSTEQQKNGSWSATAHVTDTPGGPFQVRDQPTVQQAATAARALATAAVDAGRTTQGKP